MAADANVLREFLVSLGYKIDKGSERQFQRGLEAATEQAKRLGTAVAATAAAVATAATAMASKLEGLYYASRRTGASVESIRAFSYAVSQMGGTAEGAMASLEGLAQAMRNNPGIRGMVAGLVAPGTNLDDAEATIRALGDRFRGMERGVAVRYAGMLGIDERTLQAIIDGVGEFSDEYRQLARRMGVDSRQAAEASREFMRSMRGLQAVGEIALTKLTIALAPVAPQIKEMAEQFVMWVERVTPKIDEVVRSTIGWENAIKLIGAAITLSLLPPLTRLATVLGGLVALKMPAWLMRLLGVVAVGEIAVIQGEAERSGKALSIPEAIREWLRQKGVQFQSDPQAPNAPQQPSSGQDPRGLRNNNPLNLSFSPEQRGLDPNAPHDGRFGRYVSMEAGIASAARQLLRYQERYGLNNVAGIISRWAPPGENDTAAYIDRVSKALGIRPGDPLDLRNPSTMATLVGAMARVEVGRPLMSDTIARGVGMALGQQPAGSNPTFAQTTNITVQGASDPAGTAHAIGREQDRVNADIIRNLQGAMR